MVLCDTNRAQLVGSCTNILIGGSVNSGLSVIIFCSFMKISYLDDLLEVWVLYFFNIGCYDCNVTPSTVLILFIIQVSHNAVAS
jgi:hypothetical protein